jgi:hypothetical protein
MTTALHTHREPIRRTFVRTILIAIVAGSVLAVWSARSARPVGWPVAVLLVLWVSLGGHWLELGYLAWLRPHIPSTPEVQRVARLAFWFLGGCALAIGMALTARILAAIPFTDWHAWWLAGVAFIGVELAAHIVLQARGRPSFFNGRG